MIGSNRKYNAQGGLCPDFNDLSHRTENQSLVGSDPSSPQNQPQQLPQHFGRYYKSVLRLRERVRHELVDIADQSIESLGFPAEHLFGEGRFLGEYYCLWIADTLDLKDQDQIEDLGVATVFARAHAILTDHLVDRREAVDPQIPHLAAFFLAKSVSLFRSVLPDASSFDRHLEWCLLEARRTDMYEWIKHRGILTRYGCRDMATLGGKTSICFLPAIAVCLLANRRECIPLFKRVIERRNVAVQIRDDLADWREDLAAHNFTLPLTLALDLASSAKSGQSLDWDIDKLAPLAILDILVRSELVDKLCMLASAYVRLAERHLTAVFTTSPLLGYFHSMNVWMELFIERMFRLRIDYDVKVPKSETFRIGGRKWPTLEVRLPVRRRLSEEGRLSTEAYMEFENLVKELHPRPWAT